MGKKRILILGGEGFVGRNIADSLSASFACFSLDRKKSIFPKRQDKFIKADPYREKITGRYDAIIHLIDNKIKKGVLFKKAEQQLLENANLQKGVQLVLFSSAAVYANPDSEYAKRKIQLEKIYQDYARQKGIKLAIFRLFNTYGPYQIPGRPGSLVANIFYNYLDKKPVEINDKKAKRDFIFAGDIGKISAYAVKKALAGTFDICTDKLSTIKNILGLISKIVGKKILVNDQKISEKIICPAGKNVLSDKIKLTSLEQGLKKTYNFYKRNLNTLKKSQHENI